MAIFGDVIADAQKVREYEPRPSPALNPVSLPKSVDPSNSSEPTMIAQQLISLLPDSPPLSLIVRLMFCLKPPNEDWEHPDFPYLYSDLDSEDEMYSIATLVQSISRPVKDDVSVHTLSTFAERIIDLLEPKVSLNFIEFLHSIQMLLNRAQMMPTTSLSYLAFLHLNGRLFHGHFWFVPFLASSQILVSQNSSKKLTSYRSSINKFWMKRRCFVCWMRPPILKLPNTFLAMRLFCLSSRAFRTIQEQKNHC